MIHESVSAAAWTTGVRGFGNHLWQSTLFAGMMALLALALRKNHASTRYTLWMTASVKFLIPFSLLVSLGNHLPLHSHAEATRTNAYASIDEISQPFSNRTTPRTPIAIYVPSLTPSGPSSRLLFEALAGIWLIGVLTTMGIGVVQWRRISYVVRSARPLLQGRVVDLLRKAEKEARLARPIALLLATDSMEPGVFGFSHPVLLWPESISTRLDDAHLESVFAHEVCHVQRYDNLTSVIHMLVEAIFWFHPLIWWIETQLVKERERACDEKVLQMCGQPSVYAESILKVCEFCVSPPVTCVAGITGADLKKRIALVMNGHKSSKLNWGKKILVAATGLLSVVGPVTYGMLNAVPGRAQQVAGTAIPDSVEFAVASIRPDEESGGTSHYVNIGFTKDGFNATGVTFDLLLQRAYGIHDERQIVGAPKWFGTQSFSIEAKLDDATADAVSKLDSQQVELAHQHMLQKLLADRFMLLLHRDTKDLPIFSLIVAKDGPKLHEEKPGDTYANGAKSPGGVPYGPHFVTYSFEVGHVQMKGQGASLDLLVTRLTQHAQWLQLGRTIVNNTGLTGSYDFDLDFTVPWGANGDQGTTNSSAPGLFTAFQEQIGLKLVPTKGPVETLVIDHVASPSEN